MATITVKKKKPLALRTPGEGEVTTDGQDAAGMAGGPVLSAAPGLSAREPSYALYAILAMVATVCFLVLLLLQWIEYRHYDAPPGVFPKAVASATS
jgi:hypothetical protein